MTRPMALIQARGPGATITGWYVAFPWLTATLQTESGVSHESHRSTKGVHQPPVKFMADLVCPTWQNFRVEQLA